MITDGRNKWVPLDSLLFAARPLSPPFGPADDKGYQQPMRQDTKGYQSPSKGYQPPAYPDPQQRPPEGPPRQPASPSGPAWDRYPPPSQRPADVSPFYDPAVEEEETEYYDDSRGPLFFSAEDRAVEGRSSGFYDGREWAWRANCPSLVPPFYQLCPRALLAVPPQLLEKGSCQTSSCCLLRPAQYTV